MSPLACIGQEWRRNESKCCWPGQRVLTIRLSGWTYVVRIGRFEMLAAVFASNALNNLLDCRPFQLEWLADYLGVRRLRIIFSPVLSVRVSNETSTWRSSIKILSSCRWGLEFVKCIPYRGVRPSSEKGVSLVWKNCIRWRVSCSGSQGVWSNYSLPLLPGPLWLTLVVSVRVPSMGRIDLFKNCEKILRNDYIKNVNMSW